MPGKSKRVFSFKKALAAKKIKSKESEETRSIRKENDRIRKAESWAKESVKERYIRKEKLTSRFEQALQLVIL